MKKLIFIFIAASVFSNFFLSKEVVAQTCGIDSIYIIPENPTEFDSIQVVYIATFISAPVYVFSMDIQEEGKDIKIFAKYCRGGAQAITTISDTLNIGIYKDGKYNLIYDAEDYSCWVDADTTLYGSCVGYSLTFVVGSGAGIDEVTLDNSFSLYPNPADNEFVLESKMFDTEDISIEIYSICGKRCFPNYYHNISNASINVHVNELSQGMYYIRVLRNKEVIGLKKWIKMG